MQEFRWHKIEDIFNRAVGLPAAERKSFVESECGSDKVLCSEIISLVEGDSRENDFLNEPVFALGAEILENDWFELLKNGDFSFYRLKKLLGRGGTGAVFLAEDTRLGRDTALKIFPALYSTNSEVIKRFENEARTASSVAHKNIAHIYEFGSHEKRYFLAMEYVPGANLRKLIKENLIDQPKALDIVCQIADALCAAHRKKIIHRDVKPENVIVQEDGLVKVLDFGLAKLNAASEFDEMENSPELKKPLIMGTISYMSPEQAAGKEVSPPTDIWSLGVVFYEMLTGKRPFVGVTLSEAIPAIENDFPPPSAINPAIPAEIERIILKMLEKDSAERYQTIEELLIDLEPNIYNSGGDASEFKKSRTKSFFAVFSEYKVFTAIVLIIILGSIISIFYRGSANEATSLNALNADSIKSIAVLPLTAKVAGAETEYLSEGLTESLIGKLAQLPQLTVKARNSVFYYKNKNVNAQTAGRELAVQAVLLGHINKTGDNLTLDMELIEVATGNRIWGEQYNRKNSDLLILQNEIALDVSNKLRARLSGVEAQRLAKNYTQNAEAFELYLKGRFHWNKRTAKDLQKSIEYYDCAIALDSKFALAYAGLADTYVLLSGFAVASPHESFPKAKAAARKALEIDETLAEAHCALSYALFNYDWNFEESEKEMKRAIELNPNYATAHHWYGNANLLAAGRLEESIEELKIALQLDPLSLIVNADLATNYLFARQPDKAIEQYKKTLEMDENFNYAHVYLGRGYMMKGDFEQAIAELQKAQAANDDPRISMLFAVTYALWNKRDESVKWLDKMNRLSKERYVSAYYFALVHTALGEKDKAFEYLDKGLSDHEGRMTLIKVDPLLDNLRADARFPVLMRKVGLEK